MELILISERKLKVMLTKADMDALELTCDNIDYDNTETRRAFWSILDEAKHKTGFDAAADRVYIQVYPGRNGGCELYVTKLAGERDGGVTVKQSTHAEAGAAYRFESMELLLLACKRLRDASYSGGSEAFFADRRYYLTLTDPPGQYDYVSEYGMRLSGELHCYFTEHGKPICGEEAVATLAELI